MRKFAIACVLAMVVPTAAAMGMPLKPWVGVSGSINTYEMGDINDEINSIDFSSLEEIGTGFSFGVHGGLGITPMLTATAGYEFLTAGSAATDIAAASEFDFNFPAHAFRAGLELRAPTPGPLKLAAGASAGMIRAAGDVLVAAGVPEDVAGSVSGSGPLFEGYASADLWFTPLMAISPAIGYRYAKISEVKLEDVVQADTSLDYSGYFMRLSLKIGLP